MENIETIFKEKHLNLTKPRIEIYKFIKAHPIHPTAETVYRAVQKKLPNISFATVYNVLNKFIELGLVKEFNIGKETRFDGNTVPHIHFVCLKCGKVEDADFSGYDKISEAAQKRGWDVKEFSLFIYGICPQCKKSSNH